MKNKFLIAAFFSIFLLIGSNVQAANFKDNQTVGPNKTWTVKFTGEVGYDELTRQGITVTDSKGNVLPVELQLGGDNKTIIVTPPQGGYTPGESYILNIGTKIHSNKGKALKNEYKIHFNITSDILTTCPQIKSVTSTDNEEIDIVFDRPMDKETALDLANYQLNAVNLSNILGAQISLDNNDCTVKITGSSGRMNIGANVLYIKNNVKDTYGNKVADDTRISFNVIKDEVKPTVISVTSIDSETIKVQFSKTVRYEYATNLSNYELLDSQGVDITGHIKRNSNPNDKGIYSIKGMFDTRDTDTYIIKLQKYNPDNTNEDWRLTSSKYTLTIKNIVDTALTPNIMDNCIITF